MTPRPSSAQEGRVDVPFDEDLDLYFDPKAQQGKCLVASILKYEGSKLLPDAYRAHIWLKISDTISEHTSILVGGLQPLQVR